MAILTALASPEDLEVLAITAVAGNVPIERTVVNSLALAQLANRPEVPVYRGAARPMVNELVTAEYVHGPTGLDGSGLGPPTLKESEGTAVDYLIEELLSRDDGATTVCTLGPLTNVGMALTEDPSLVAKIDQIVMMGGAFAEGGNVTEAAEFNIYVDPHAADVVFSSGIPIVMMPLDLTHKALATDQRVERFRALGTAAGRSVAGMLDYFERWDKEKYGFPGGPLHDPTVIAYVIDPSIFEGEHQHVWVETSAGPVHGATLIGDSEPNTQVMLDLDADRFFDLLVERVGRL